MLKAKDDNIILNGELSEIYLKKEDDNFYKFCSPFANGYVFISDDKEDDDIESDIPVKEMPFFVPLFFYITFYLMLVYLFTNII